MLHPIHIKLLSKATIAKFESLNRKTGDKHS